jgi:hypothetical protein
MVHFRQSPCHEIVVAKEGLTMPMGFISCQLHRKWLHFQNLQVCQCIVILTTDYCPNVMDKTTSGKGLNSLTFISLFCFLAYDYIILSYDTIKYSIIQHFSSYINLHIHCYFPSYSPSALSNSRHCWQIHAQV